MDETKDAITNFINNMAALFRYLFPGVVVMSLIMIFAPDCAVLSLLQNNDGEYNWYGITLITICLGSIISAFNRSAIMTIEDMAYDSLRHLFPQINRWRYLQNLSTFLKYRFKDEKEFFNYSFLRRSQCHLLLVLAEAFLAINLITKTGTFLFGTYICGAAYLLNSFIVERLEKMRANLS